MSKYNCKDIAPIVYKAYGKKIDANKYFIRSDGKIYSLMYRRALNPTLRNQYYAVNCCKQTLTLHRVLAVAFCHNPDPDTHTYVDHKDGNKFNNDVKNLQWITPSENVKRGKRLSRECGAPPLHDSQLKIILKAIRSEKPAEHPELVALLNL